MDTSNCSLSETQRETMAFRTVLGLATYLRPQMLRETLKSLIALELNESWELILVLVDNDKEESARQVFEEMKPQLGFSSKYIVQQERGIVNTRNSVLDEAINLNAEYIAFIDDDEVVPPEWFRLLSENLIKYNADVAQGSCKRVLPENAPYWIEKGRFFNPRNYPTGKVRKSASTNNVLFNIRLIKEMNLRFHPYLNLTGSSDSFFFSEAHSKGAKIVWVEEAYVKETVPHSRANFKWIVKRAYRSGNSFMARMYLKQEKTSIGLRLTRYVARHLVASLFELFSCPFRGKAAFVRAMTNASQGVGATAYVFGHSYKEYKTIHGH